MKILAVSDVVDNQLYSPQAKRLAEDVDLIISCGDLPAYYLDFLVSTLGKPLFYICGNHDHYGVRKTWKADINAHDSFFSSKFNYNKPGNFGGKNLDQKIVRFKNMIFGGLEGSFLYNYGEHQYSERQMKRKVRKMTLKFLKNKLSKGRYLDVLITHAPPRGIHDKDDLAHRGFESFIDIIDRYHPKYLLHGHIHLYDRRAERITEYQGTKIINCYGFQILDL